MLHDACQLCLRQIRGDTRAAYADPQRVLFLRFLVILMLVLNLNIECVELKSIYLSIFLSFLSI